MLGTETVRYTRQRDQEIIPYQLLAVDSEDGRLTHLNACSSSV